VDEYDETRGTTLYPRAAVEEAATRISSQGLWLLLSLDHYGWRAEYDAIRALLAVRGEEPSHVGEHAPLAALGHLFALVDKLWRLVYGIRAHRAGREFLSKDDGYLAGGYKLHPKLRQLADIDPDEWSALLGVPSPDMIRDHLGASGEPSEEIAIRIAFAKELPALIATNMSELLQYFERQETTTGPVPTTFSLRQFDDRHRHGAPVVYHDCSPADVGWVSVRHREGDHRSDTVGVVMTPPDEEGRAYIGLFKHDAEMVNGLLNASSILAALVRRLARAYLAVLAAGLVDPLASVADYDV